MILVIRGHIRETFFTRNFYDLIKNISNTIPDLKIFIHTWNIISNNISWRNIKQNNTIVTEETIYNYFGDLKHLIKHIIIDDDTKVKLIGNLRGKINKSSMPIIGWKYYWYGKFQIINYINNQNTDNNNIYDNEMIINLRFDVLNNSHSLSHDFIMRFINYYIIKYNDNIIVSNLFIKQSPCNGIDNIYIGNIYTLYKLTEKFYNNFTDIILKNPKIRNQEWLVFIVNYELFNNKLQFNLFNHKTLENNISKMIIL
mgnify:CR=1 FL=1